MRDSITEKPEKEAGCIDEQLHCYMVNEMKILLLLSVIGVSAMLTLPVFTDDVIRQGL